AVTVDEARFLETLEGEDYREAVRDLLQLCRALDLRFEWGTRGTSIRLPNQDRTEPLSVGWLFPSTGGWMGLRDLNLGIDPGSAAQVPSLAEALAWYTEQVGAL